MAALDDSLPRLLAFWDTHIVADLPAMAVHDKERVSHALREFQRANGNLSAEWIDLIANIRASAWLTGRVEKSPGVLRSPIQLSAALQPRTAEKIRSGHFWPQADLLARFRSEWNAEAAR